MSGEFTPIERASALLQQLAASASETGRESVVVHGRATLAILESLNVDEPTRVAALLFGLTENELDLEAIGAGFGSEARTLVAGMRQLLRLENLTRKDASSRAAVSSRSEVETLRRMTLAMASDIRVVLLRLSSRLQTLRFHAECQQPPDRVIAQETLDILAPLANRLGLGQLKWELEDLAFRFLEPELYRGIAAHLEERRAERELFVRDSVERLRQALLIEGIGADVSGRPKHIRSIHNKMQAKSLDFNEIQDLRALRVLVDDVKDCYAALVVTHQIWPPMPREFDDYVARPKANGYQSLHTVVTADDGRPLEIQIRTRAMHQHAEFGVASHWRYKEASRSGLGRAQTIADISGEPQVARIEWMRQLLMWQQEVGATLGGQLSTASDMDGELIYLLTPQARVVELPQGATPVDFAYHIHTHLGHRCRGARVDGQMVPLNTPLQNGQTVEIITARGPNSNEGPSRDWLNAQLGFVRSGRARAKVRQWFHTLDTDRDLAIGREKVERALQREGRTTLAHDQLARRLDVVGPEALFLAVAREEIGPRALQEAIRSGSDLYRRAEGTRLAPDDPQADRDGMLHRIQRAGLDQSAERSNPVRVAGVDFLLTQLARCCRPVPPDLIRGFITRGKGVSVHRSTCKSLLELSRRSPERVLETDWGYWEARSASDRARSVQPRTYLADLLVRAHDRQGLLRDVSDVFARDRLNVTAVKTLSRKGVAEMRFTVEVHSLTQLRRTLESMSSVRGVLECERV